MTSHLSHTVSVLFLIRNLNYLKSLFLEGLRSIFSHPGSTLSLLPSPNHRQRWAWLHGQSVPIFSPRASPISPRSATRLRPAIIGIHCRLSLVALRTSPFALCPPPVAPVLSAPPSRTTSAAARVTALFLSARPVQSHPQGFTLSRRPKPYAKSSPTSHLPNLRALPSPLPS